MRNPRPKEDFVEVRNNDVNGALRKFKRKINEDGIPQTLRQKEFYEKPSENVNVPKRQVEQDGLRKKDVGRKSLVTNASGFMVSKYSLTEDDTGADSDWLKRYADPLRAQTKAKKLVMQVAGKVNQLNITTLIKTVFIRQSCIHLKVNLTMLLAT